jgi:hypothetical protein
MLFGHRLLLFDRLDLGTILEDDDLSFPLFLADRQFTERYGHNHLWRYHGIWRVLSNRVFRVPLWYQLQYGAGEDPDKTSGRATFYLQTGAFQERARQDSNLRPSES